MSPRYVRRKYYRRRHDLSACGDFVSGAGGPDSAAAAAAPAVVVVAEAEESE